MLSAIWAFFGRGMRLPVRCMTRGCLGALGGIRRKDTGRPGMASGKAHLCAMQEYHQEKKGDTTPLVNSTHSGRLAQEKD